MLVGLDAQARPDWTQTSQDLLERAGAWRRCFRSHGLRAGDPVALALSRGPDLAALHLAALAGGHPIVPINTAMTGREVARVLDAARPALVVAAPVFRRSHAAVAADEHAAWRDDVLDASFAADPAAARRMLEPADCDDSAPALIIFTSGTTGAPKSVPLSNGNLLANLQTLAAIWECSPQDRLLHVLPAHHYHGLVLALYGTLLAGSTAFLMPAFDPRTTLAALGSLDIDVLMAVPTIYSRLVSTDGSAGALARLRLAVSGSAPLPAALWHGVQERLGTSLVNRYGLTETGIVTSTSPHAPRPGTVGAPLPGTRIVLRTDAGRYLERRPGAASERGEICIAAPSVTAGYGNAPEANAAAFAHGLFHSGDLGRFDEQGDLWVDGRIKELIIVGGSNVVPGEVEGPLSAVPGVAEIVAAGVAHEDLGEVVGAFVVPSPGADQAALEAALRTEAERSLAPYKRPRAYRFLTEIPRNAMGKIDRSRLDVRSGVRS